MGSALDHLAAILAGIRSRQLSRISISKDLSSADTIHRISAHFCGVKLRKFLALRTNLYTCVYMYIYVCICSSRVKQDTEWIDWTFSRNVVFTRSSLFTIRRFDRSCSKYIVDRLSTGCWSTSCHHFPLRNRASACTNERENRLLRVEGKEDLWKYFTIGWREMVTMSRVKSGEILSWQRRLETPLSALILFPCASIFKESVPKCRGECVCR